MENFTVTIDTTVRNFWGWWLVWALVGVTAVLLILWICQMIFDWYTDFDVALTVAALVTVFAAFFVWLIWSEQVSSTQESRIWAQLVEDGWESVIRDGSQYILTQDGVTTVYNVTVTADRTEYNFYPINQ